MKAARELHQDQCADAQERSPPFSNLTTRELVARYNETATWDYRKDQYADALDARAYDWDGHESVDSRDLAELDL